MTVIVEEELNMESQFPVLCSTTCKHSSYIMPDAVNRERKNGLGIFLIEVYKLKNYPFYVKIVVFTA